MAGERGGWVGFVVLRDGEMERWREKKKGGGGKGGCFEGIGM